MRAGKFKTSVQNSLLIVGSLLVFFGLFEAGTRLLQALELLPVLDGNSIALKSPEAEKYNAKLVRSDNPILAIEYDTAHPAINAFHMRDKPYDIERPEGVRRVAVMGDSVTFGLGVPLEKTYNKLLQRRLNSTAGAGERFEVMNFGVSGYGTRAELEYFTQTAQQFEPEVVIIGFVMNDPSPPSILFGVVAQVQRDAREFGKLAKWSQVLAWVKMHWHRATSAVNARRAYAKYFDPEAQEWLDVVYALEEFRRLADKQQFRLLVVIFPMLYDFDDYPFQIYRDQVIAELRRLDIDYLDLLPEYRKYDPASLRFRDSDTTHPNELGHRLAAEQIYLHLMPLM